MGEGRRIPVDKLRAEIGEYRRNVRAYFVEGRGPCGVFVLVACAIPDEGDGDTWFYLDGPCEEWVEAKACAQVPEAINIPLEQAQGVLDVLWSAGVRPSEPKVEATHAAPGSPLGNELLALENQVRALTLNAGWDVGDPSDDDGEEG